LIEVLPACGGKAEGHGCRGIPSPESRGGGDDSIHRLGLDVHPDALIALPVPSLLADPGDHHPVAPQDGRSVDPPLIHPEGKEARE
jgi:hypothetical protein